jgi:hypothetical protein
MTLKNPKFIMAAASVGLAAAAFSFSSSAQDLSKYVGYTIIYKGYVTGYANFDNRVIKKDWSFEGCEFGRKIFIDDRYAVTCKEYKYHYAYHPEITILAKGDAALLLVDGEEMEISLR